MKVKINKSYEMLLNYQMNYQRIGEEVKHEMQKILRKKEEKWSILEWYGKIIKEDDLKRKYEREKRDSKKEVEKWFSLFRNWYLHYGARNVEGYTITNQELKECLNEGLALLNTYLPYLKRRESKEKGKHVLIDVGCGHSIYTHILAERLNETEIIGVDICIYTEVIKEVEKYCGKKKNLKIIEKRLKEIVEEVDEKKKITLMIINPERSMEEEIKEVIKNSKGKEITLLLGAYHEVPSSYLYSLNSLNIYDKQLSIPYLLYREKWEGVRNIDIIHSFILYYGIFTNRNAGGGI